MGCIDCLGRTPYGSLIATIILCVGVGLFCGTGFRALDITINGIFYDLFELRIPWLRNIQIAFFILGLSMAVFAIFLLFCGFLSTGRTRENVCSTVTCTKRSGISTFILLMVTYVINIGWMAMTYFCALPIFAYVMINNICRNEIFWRDYWYFEGYCLNLSRFGIYQNFTLGYDPVGLCDEVDLSIFCQQVYDAGPMFCFAYCGALLIVIGLGAYLITFGSNIVRLRSSQELTEYKRAMEMENRSLNGY